MPSSLSEIHSLAQEQMLDVVGAFHPGPGDGAPDNCETIVLLGPHEPGFWNYFRTAAEFCDGRKDPLDRWSERMIRDFAADIGVLPIFPFGGPPYAPFIAWAKLSGRSWNSPVGLLVHDEAGLLVSFRGALAIAGKLHLESPKDSVCLTCHDQPCLTACPASALNGTGYDLNACHSYLDTGAGQDCMQSGCAVRRSCPISRDYGRDTAQSAFHMKAFHQ